MVPNLSNIMVLGHGGSALHIRSAVCQKAPVGLKVTIIDEANVFCEALELSLLN